MGLWVDVPGLVVAEKEVRIFLIAQWTSCLFPFQVWRN
jgi:hypothetical protein